MNILFDNFRPKLFGSLVCLTLLLNQGAANDVREKLIVKAYDCSGFVVEATITRPLLPVEYHRYQIPQQPVGFNGGLNGSGAVNPTGGGGGFFRVSPRQGQGAGGGTGGGGGLEGGRLGGGGAVPAGGQAQPNNPQSPTKATATITYKKKDLTEMITFITQSVDPYGWSDKHARPNIRQVGSVLVVTQTQKNHDKIQQLLSMLKKAKESN